MLYWRTSIHTYYHHFITSWSMFYIEFSSFIPFLGGVITYVHDNESNLKYLEKRKLQKMFFTVNLLSMIHTEKKYSVKYMYNYPWIWCAFFCFLYIIQWNKWILMDLKIYKFETKCKSMKIGIFFVLFDLVLLCTKRETTFSNKFAVSNSTGSWVF